MTILIRTLSAFALLFGALAFNVHAQEAAPAKTHTTIELLGGPEVVTLTVESLSALPAVERDVTFKTSKGVSTGHYKGPLLWDVLAAGKVLAGLEHNAELAKTLMVTASDGYQIAFSVGEFAPEFGNVPIMIALETDGKPLVEGLRIIVPGDTRGARNVRDVTRIELR